MNIIIRPDYTDKVLRLFGKGLIIALTGQRRVGKSFIMKQVINLLSHDDNNNIIYVDKEDEQFSTISTHSHIETLSRFNLIMDVRHPASKCYDCSCSGSCDCCCPECFRILAVFCC
jgi:predicted AAA+ superfamily ATPase